MLTKETSGVVTRKAVLAGFGTAVLAGIIAVGCAGSAMAQNYYDRGNYRYDGPGLRVAHDIGFDDGALVARQDFTQRKPYQPYPRGKYANEDRGYRREYGDRYAYSQEYAAGYSQGYQRTFRRY
jgi:hypothetical protein